MTRPRYADVAATLALVVALSTGAYAAVQLPKNSVTSATVKNGSLKTKDLAKSARPSKPKGGAALSASVGPIADTKLTSSFVKIGSLSYSQPAGALDDIRGHFSLRGGVGGETCTAGNGVEYQVVVNGLEYNPEIGSGAAGSGNAAKDSDGTVIGGINGGETITDINTIGSEYPLINSTGAPVTRTVEVYMRGKGCTPTVRGLRLYVTRFLP